MSKFKLSPEKEDKVVLAACVLHNYLGNDINVDDCMIENTDTLSQFSSITTFRHSGGNASEEAMRVRDKYQQYLENVGLVPWQLEAIRRRAVKSNTINQHNIFILK
jgi:hypothetical protein